jgi:adenylate kinase family enzyme
MNDYDFGKLNDKEFEVLARDIISIKENIEVDRFKSGKDQGIDGKYIDNANGIVVIQVKHWLTSGYTKLKYHCKTIEKNKVQKLNPKKYIFITSLPLKESYKSELCEIFQPYLSSCDIYGKENLNDLLRKPDYHHVEKNHYKLWLSNTSVLSLILNSGVYSKSAYSLAEIESKCKYYVKTRNHDASKDILEETNCLIITGEPGAGKTTLAENLSYQYVTKGFEFIEIDGDMDSAWDVLSKESNQLFYFDDFLGRNYLDGLFNREDSKIVQFIKAIKSQDNKRFILTSRSSILNQGKLYSELFSINKIYKNEFELNITELERLDKAKILYNHIYFSNLSREFIDQFYYQKRYREIIEHKNFNPRLISFITDLQRYEGLNNNEYWNKIKGQINNPKDIWEFVFEQQVDDIQIAIINLVVINGNNLPEDELYRSYVDFCSFKNLNANEMKFQKALKVLTGSLLNRYISEDNDIPSFNLFNPSIADYVLPRVLKNPKEIALITISLNSIESIESLFSLKTEKLISQKGFNISIKEILNLIRSKKFNRKYFSLYTFIYSELEYYEHNKYYDKSYIQSYIHEINIHGINSKTFYKSLSLFDKLCSKEEFNKYDVNWDKVITSSLELDPDHFELIKISEIIYEAATYSDTDFTDIFNDAAMNHWAKEAHDEIDQKIDYLNIDYEDLEDTSVIDQFAIDSIEEALNEYSNDIIDVTHLSEDLIENVDSESIRTALLEAFSDNDEYEKNKQNKSEDVDFDDIDRLFQRNT